MNFTLITATHYCSLEESSPVYYVILDGSYTSITIPETKCVHVGYSSLIVTCSFSLVLIVKLPVIILFSLN